VFNLSTPIENFARVGPKFLTRLKKLGIKTAKDLLWHFPARYEDYSNLLSISDINNAGQVISIAGQVTAIDVVRSWKRRMAIVNAVIKDQSGTIRAVWFNQPYIADSLREGTLVSLSGKTSIDKNGIYLSSPSYEKIDNQETNLTHTGRLVPIYPETEGLTSKYLRFLLKPLLAQISARGGSALDGKALPDPLPSELLQKLNFPKLAPALQAIHFPENLEQAERARQRFAFEEILLFQIRALRDHRQMQTLKAPQISFDKELIAGFVKTLPFELTNDQRIAAYEILRDLERPFPMNRLLNGDVGSGKTVVAAIAAYVAYLNGFDTLLAAPTEILAFQHHQTLTEILSSWAVKIGIWTGSKKSAGNITCGTHALLSTFKQQRPIGLVIVDEQHRFGVAQRAKLFLRHNLRLTPHLLTMTATPIPRTLAFTFYGDLDLSILDEMPQGRQKIATFVVPNLKRNDAYKFIEKQVFEGRQAFIITSFIEPSETMITVKAAKVEFGKLKDKFSKNISLGLLHGRLKSKEKEEIISKFRKNKIHILVTTPVVEVGIDIPNATVMMIESAERFGLAQLHQLRGRVGRGKHKSYCLLFTDSRSPGSYKRLKSMEKIYVGAELAEIDLKMRGPGEIFGLKQSGFINLKIANLSDHQMIARAQEEAKRIIEIDPILKSFPILKQKISKLSSAFAQPN